MLTDAACDTALRDALMLYVCTYHVSACGIRLSSCWKNPGFDALATGMLRSSWTRLLEDYKVCVGAGQHLLSASPDGRVL